MSEILVTKCICHNRSFSDIREYAQEKGYASIKELQTENFCSCSCGLCIPYIKLMLKTGETVFKPGAIYIQNNVE